MADVAAVQPAVAVEHGARLRGAVQITAHDLRAANPDLAVDARCDVAATLRVDDAAFSIRDRHADGPQLDRGRILRGDDRGGARLREPVPLLQHAADAPRALLDDVR